MPIFMYTARNSQGKIVQGQQEAVSEVAAINILQGNNLYVTQIVNTAFAIKSRKKIIRHRHRKAKHEDLLFFIAQTANLLGVGIPFVRALEVIADQTESEELYGIIKEIITNVKAGSTFKDAIARHPTLFPTYWTYLVEAGEVSGTLPQVMSQLAKNLEQTENLKKKIVSALVYPSILITAALAAIIFFMVFIVPIFAKLFKSFNATLPPITLAVMGVSNFIQSNFILLILGIGSFVFFFKRSLKTASGKQFWNVFLLQLPVIGDAVSEMIHARICIILSMLIRSGLNFLKSLEITANISNNYVFQTALNNTKLDVQQGKTLSQSLGENAAFSPMFINLVKIGEESGKLPEMIEKASEYFQDRVSVFATRVGVLIEPIVMLIVGAAIGVIALSLFMPIIKLTSAIK